MNEKEALNELVNAANRGSFNLTEAQNVFQAINILTKLVNKEENSQQDKKA